MAGQSYFELASLPSKDFFEFSFWWKVVIFISSSYERDSFLIDVLFIISSNVIFKPILYIRILFLC